MTNEQQIRQLCRTYVKKPLLEQVYILKKLHKLKYTGAPQVRLALKKMNKHTTYAAERN